jgi:hypothetical protein
VFNDDTILPDSGIYKTPEELRRYITSNFGSTKEYIDFSSANKFLYREMIGDRTQKITRDSPGFMQYVRTLPTNSILENMSAWRPSAQNVPLVIETQDFQKINDHASDSSAVFSIDPKKSAFLSWDNDKTEYSINQGDHRWFFHPGEPLFDWCEKYHQKITSYQGECFARELITRSEDQNTPGQERMKILIHLAAQEYLPPHIYDEIATLPNLPPEVTSKMSMNAAVGSTALENILDALPPVNSATVNNIIDHGNCSKSLKTKAIYHTAANFTSLIKACNNASLYLQRVIHGHHLNNGNADVMDALAKNGSKYPKFCRELMKGTPKNNVLFNMLTNETQPETLQAIADIDSSALSGSNSFSDILGKIATLDQSGEAIIDQAMRNNRSTPTVFMRALQNKKSTKKNILTAIMVASERVGEEILKPTIPRLFTVSEHANQGPSHLPSAEKIMRMAIDHNMADKEVYREVASRSGDYRVWSTLIQKKPGVGVEKIVIDRISGMDPEENTVLRKHLFEKLIETVDDLRVLHPFRTEIMGDEQLNKKFTEKVLPQRSLVSAASR